VAIHADDLSLIPADATVSVTTGNNEKEATQNKPN